MDTLEGIQRLFQQAKTERVEPFDVVDRVRRQTASLTMPQPEACPIVWKVSAAISALAAVIPLVLLIQAFLAIDDLMIAFFLPSQGAWPW